MKNPFQKKIYIQFIKLRNFVNNNQFQTNMQDRSNSKLSNHDNKQQAQYKEKYDKIQNVIEDLNGKLMSMFQKKEKDLIEEYKKQMFKVQNQLNELRENTNQEELRKKFIEHKQQLQKQRQQFLQASIHFSNKCETYKQKLHKVINQTADLENQIKFLNEQINNANRKNLKLKEELNISREKTIFSTQKKQIIPNQVNPTTYRNSNISTNLKVKLQSNKKMDSAQESELIDSNSKIRMKRNLSYNQEMRKIKDKNKKLKQVLVNPVLKQTEFQKLFIESVKQVKEKKMEKMKGDKKSQKMLPSLKKNIIESQKAYTKIMESDLTDFDKRHIMQDFLSKQQVKVYLYKIIFKDVNLQQELKSHKKQKEDS